MKRKVVSMVLAGVMATSMLVGCGAKKEETSTPEETVAQEQTAEEKTEEKKELRMIGASIHAGEKIEIYEDTLITGKINPGAIVQVYAKLYVMQGVFGIIEGQSEEACISSQRFKNATIRFFGKSIHHFTTFEMSLVYYKDNDIVVEKGDYIHV